MPEITIPSSSSPPMCRRKGDTLASLPTPRSATRSSTSQFSSTTTSTIPTATTSSSSSSFSAASIATLRISLPILFPFAEIAAATNNFLANRISSSSWRCTLRGHDSLVLQRAFRGDPAALPARLSAVCRSHHRSVAKLLGASLSAGRIYLVYRFVAGASSLADCLHSPRNPSFTPLSSWISRMQVATDLAQGLEYIHHHSAGGGIVHNRVKSSGILVTEPRFNAVICHYAAAFLAGDVPEAAENSSDSVKRIDRSNSHLKRIEGTRGYLAPEVIAGGDASRRSDVFALGVLMLELISGEVPVKFMFDGASREYRSSSLIEIAREVFGEEEGRRTRIRGWVDRRLKDSFPVEVAEKMVGIALRCVEEEAERRPSVSWVQGKVSKFFLKSEAWAERVKAPADISVSLAPR